MSGPDQEIKRREFRGMKKTTKKKNSLSVQGESMKKGEDTQFDSSKMTEDADLELDDVEEPVKIDDIIIVPPRHQICIMNVSHRWINDVCVG